MTKAELETAQRKTVEDRTLGLVESMKLQQFGYSDDTIVTFVELLRDMQMQAWHEGAIAACNRMLAQVS